MPALFQSREVVVRLLYLFALFRSRNAFHEKGQLQVLVKGEIGEDAAFRGHERDTEVHDGLRSQARDDITVKRDSTRGRRGQAQEAPQRRCLAGPVPT